MKSIRQRSIALAVALTLTLITLTTSAPNASASTRYRVIAGRVIKKDMKERQMLVADRSSKKLYLINVAEDASFKITFGRNMQLSAAGLKDVDRNNRVELRITRTDKEHLSRLYDGREVIEVDAAH
ncbi:MAG TPA: hypothetical protein VKA70_15650 [Blastocatellia bacterium]|nr:hypothetical protein [Blastocatellia bacterium]